MVEHSRLEEIPGRDPRWRIVPSGRHNAEAAVLGLSHTVCCGTIRGFSLDRRCDVASVARVVLVVGRLPCVMPLSLELLN